MKLISIVTPVFNEEDNVQELCERIAAVMVPLDYAYEHILIDNHSTDDTLERLRDIARRDAKVKIIVNARNFGYIRSSFHGLLQAAGDAVILMASDLQDPPEMIPQLIRKWEAGYKSVLAVKPDSDESRIMFRIRRMYYSLINRISETPVVENATGSGLFDRRVIDILSQLEDPYPYFRGLISEIGLSVATVPFRQPRRKRGVTKNNFYSLYDMAMLGVTNHSKVPLRLMTMTGFMLSVVSFLVALGYLVAKLVAWNSFEIGLAPILIGVFFFGAVQMFSLGLLGEYIGAIQTRVRRMPLVTELERVNFEEGSDGKEPVVPLRRNATPGGAASSNKC